MTRMSERTVPDRAPRRRSHLKVVIRYRLYPKSRILGGLVEGQASDRLTHHHGRRASLNSISSPSLHVQSPSAEQAILDQIAPKLQGQVRASPPSGVSRWLNTVKPEAPAGKAIFDNSAAHRHPWVIDGLKRRPQWRLHFTPTSAPGPTPSRALSPSFPSVVSPVATSTRRRSPGRRQPLRRTTFSSPSPSSGPPSQTE